MTDDEQQELLGALREYAGYYGRELTQGTVQFYLSDLDQYPIKEVLYAMRTHRTNPASGTYFPKSSEIIRRIHDERMRNVKPRQLESYAHAKDPCARKGTRISYDRAQQILLEAGMHESQVGRAVLRNLRKLDRYAGPRPETVRLVERQDQALAEYAAENSSDEQTVSFEDWECMA